MCRPQYWALFPTRFWLYTSTIGCVNYYIRFFTLLYQIAYATMYGCICQSDFLKEVRLCSLPSHLGHLWVKGPQIRQVRLCVCHNSVRRGNHFLSTGRVVSTFYLAKKSTYLNKYLIWTRHSLGQNATWTKFFWTKITWTKITKIAIPSNRQNILHKT